MKRREAEKFEMELTQLLEKNASEHGVDKSLAGEIIGRSIHILLDDRNRGIVPIGQRRFSRRPGNLFVDMRHAVESLYSLAAERAPGREISLIQMMLEAIFLIRPDGAGIPALAAVPGGSVTGLNGKEAYAVCLLHERGLYRRTSEGADRNGFLSELMRWCPEEKQQPLTHDDAAKAVENLLEAGVLSGKEGKISLTDRVWRKVLPEWIQRHDR